MEKQKEKQTYGEIIKTLEVGKGFTTLAKAVNGGSIQVRRLTTGVQFYWRYGANGRTERIPIGAYDSSAPPRSLTPTKKGYSVWAAFAKAEELAHLHKQHLLEGGYRAIEAKKKEATKAARAEFAALEQQTLTKLLTAYCDHLEAKGKRSHIDARNFFENHVIKAWPKLAEQPANKLTTTEAVDMLRRLEDNGKGRTANKVRSAMRAAFQVAVDVWVRQDIPVTFKQFSVRNNPLAETKRNAAADKADKNPLSPDEMRAYWQAIKHLDGHKGAALRLHLLTGGQRIEQLIRVTQQDLKDDCLVLHDGKGGAGAEVREHPIPLLPLAKDALTVLGSHSPFILSNDGGNKPIAAIMLTRWAQAVNHGIENFQIKRIRSGVETLLASLGVNEEHRGRLQSHGVSGVQSRHYNGWQYMAEKEAALTAMLNFLESANVENVIPLRGTAA